MIYCATGHRPPRVGGYDATTQDDLYLFAVDVLKRYKPERMITGMAQGWDTAIARASISLKIPFVAAVPFDGQGKSWGFAAYEQYQYLLCKADEVHIISPVYDRKVFEKRDKWMVDNSEAVLALYDSQEHGGTWLTVNYANQAGHPVYNFWNEWMRINER